jgi:hypothetical protein
MNIYNNYIKSIIENKYNFEMIVSHDEDGEYGHIQNKRVHEIAKYISNILNKPFFDFKTRFDINNLNNISYINKRNESIKIYKSQQHIIKIYNDFFNNKV